jgi:hypothetical protein
MRQMAAALLLCAVRLSAQGPSPEQPVKALESAFRDGGEEARVEAIRVNGRVPDERVVALVDDGLRDPSRAVRREAITALGWNPSSAALDRLTQEYWKNTALRDDAELHALLIKAIGRHGSPKSIAVLVDSPFRNLTLENGTARIMGLGNIRSDESVKALVDLSKRAAPNRGRRGGEDAWSETFGPAFRVALTVLTGQDLGMSRAAWQKWWSDNQKGFAVAPARPAVPDDVSKFFEQYWEVPYGPAATQLAFHAGGSPYGWIEKPTDAQVKEAVADLKEAYASGNDDEIVAAIEENAKVNDPDIVRLVAKGLSMRAPVQIAAIRVLGWTPGKDALRQLHRLYYRDRSLRDREDVFAALLKEIGRHGDKASVEVLSDSPFKGLTVESGRARILGLANIRTTKSLEEIVKGLRLSGDSRGRKSKEPVFMEDFRLAFAVLTGVDCGANRDAMDAWWRDHKGFKVSPDRPPVPPALQERWERYWRTPY